jgi:hypothetical protein
MTTETETPDAHFTMKRTGLFHTPICDTCGRGPKRHDAIKGEGKFAGWTRYRCKV